MKRKYWATSVVLLTSLLVAYGSGAMPSPPQTNSDSRKVLAESTYSNNPQASAQRVVALTSLTADLIQQLDSTKLVGISGSSLLKQDPRFQSISAVSAERSEPNLEKIVALKPDLVIGAKGFHDQALQKLKELGIATMTTEVDSVSSLTALTQTLAKRIGADPKPLIESFQTFWADPPKQTPSTLVLVSQQPILSPNKNSWAGNLLKQFKAKNLAAELQGESSFGGYTTLSPEKVLETNPQVIILIKTPSPKDDSLQQLKSQPFWKQLKAVQSNRVYVLDYYGIVNPGSLDKIKQACKQLRTALSS
jgi:iron complex transport system substrate-binding protein